MSSPEIKFDCPACGEGLAIDRRAIGHQVACPFCKDPITVPDVPEPDEISVEPIQLKQGLPPQNLGSPSLEELAGSRPEVPVVAPKRKMEQSGVILGTAESTAPAQTSEVKKGGLPPKRKAGEAPRVVAEGPPGAPVAPGGNRVPVPPDRDGVPLPPGAAGKQRGMVPNPPVQARAGVASGMAQSAPQQSNGGAASSPPAGFEEKVRRKRKRRNPDEHRLNPREHPKMVAFDEVVDEDSFRKHPGHGKLPWWKKLGIIGAILGILAAIGLGILKKQQLRAAASDLVPVEMTELEKEFEIAKKRTDEFRAAGSVTEKMSFVRVPITQIDGYPSLQERMNEYYSRNTLKAHFPKLDKRSTEIIKQGDSEFVKIAMTNGTKNIETFLYFEKSPAGYALDWDSFVGYNPVSWTEFLVNPSGNSEPSIFRLIVEPKDNYTGRFQDKTRFQSYKITDMATAMSAIAYVVRGSTAGDTLEAEFKELRLEDEKRILIVAEVNLDEVGVNGAHLTYIEKILRTSWLLP